LALVFVVVVLVFVVTTAMGTVVVVLEPLLG
jgi:hypothetical protein